jgi:hypothetical protein
MTNWTPEKAIDCVKYNLRCGEITRDEAAILLKRIYAKYSLDYKFNK